MAAALPTDVLRILFAPLALRHRLRIAARVCRRWRTAAYLTVTAIEPPLVYTGPLDLYPNLTACHFTADRVPPKTWWPEQVTRITSLHLGQTHDQHLAAMAKMFRSLKRLDASNLAEEAAQYALSFVRANAATLEHISMPPSADANEGSVPEALPALRSLSAVAHVRAFAPFITQLTRLDVERLPQDVFPDPCSLTALRALRIMPQHTVLPVIDDLPSLTALELHSHTPMCAPQLPNAKRTVLVSAHVDFSFLITSAALASCTRLADISCSLRRPLEVAIQHNSALYFTLRPRPLTSPPGACLTCASSRCTTKRWTG